MSCQTHVGRLFLPCPDGHAIQPRDCRVDQLPPRRHLEEPSFMNRQVRNGIERPKVEILANRSVGIFVAIHTGREVSNLVYRVTRQGGATESTEIQPLERSALEAAIVEIE